MNLERVKQPLDEEVDVILARMISDGVGNSDVSTDRRTRNGRNRHKSGINGEYATRQEDEVVK